MRKHLTTAFAMFALALLTLSLGACSTTDDSGTHQMGGRSGGPMADEMMPGTR